MQRLSLKMLLMVALTQVILAPSAQAQATRTWVSGVGDDVNPCSRTAPCKTFAGAIGKTAARGEINVLDPAGYGAVTITKSITIRSDHTEAGVLVSGSNGIVVNAGPSDNVALEGLDIDGLSGGSSLSGINIVAGGDILIKDMNIRGFDGPNSAGVLINNSTNFSRVLIQNATIHDNTIGISMTSSGAGSASLRLFDSTISDNAIASLRVNGANNDARVANTRLVASPKSFEILAGGTVKSFGNNVLGVTDLPTSTLPLQ